MTLPGSESLCCAQVVLTLVFQQQLLPSSEDNVCHSQRTQLKYDVQTHGLTLSLTG